jgi:site-specific DNA-cytosine methylase
MLFAGALSLSHNYVEWDKLGRLILQQHSEEAKVFGDFYKREWSQHDLFSEVIVAWPMCRHLSKAGRRKMHLDSVASQVVDILHFVQQFCKYLVIYENVSNLVVLDEVHGILSCAITQYDSKGWVFAGIIWMDDDLVGGRSNRIRPLVVSDEQSAP